MTKLMSRRHHNPAQIGGLCDGEATVIANSAATEIFLRCAPVASGTSKNGCRRQTDVLYDSLAQLLDEVGAKMDHVVAERVFFRNVTADFDDFQAVRTDAYRKQGLSGNLLPATTYLQQPPCRLGQDIEMQAYVLVPQSSETARVHHLSTSQEHATVKLLEIGPARHLYIGNLIGTDDDGRLIDGFRGQSDAMFAAAEAMLQEHGLAFPDVLRTWIHLEEMERDYDELNASRNAFFAEHNVERLPASTGISAGLHPPGALGSLDVYALMNPEIAQIELMHTPTLNEAPEYGSAFARGMKMALPEQTNLFISGTASVDEVGATVHTGDVRAQFHRTLTNIEGLLKPHGATFADMAHVVTFLKSAGDRELFDEVCQERGFVDTPHSIVEAHVCRPDLLCEIEGIAVVPTV